MTRRWLFLLLTTSFAGFAAGKWWWESTEPPQNPVMPAISNNLQLAEWRFLSDPDWCRRIDYTSAQAAEERRLYRRWIRSMAPCDILQNLVLLYGFDYRTSEEVRWAFDAPIRASAEKQVGGRLPHITPAQARALEAAAAKELGPWLWSDSVVANKIGIDSVTVREVHRKWNVVYNAFGQECKRALIPTSDPTPAWVLRLEGDLPFQRVVKVRKRMEAELLAMLSPESQTRWNAMLAG